jgi:hypothetical protein
MGLGNPENVVRFQTRTMEFYLHQNAGTGYTAHPPCFSVGVLERGERPQDFSGFRSTSADAPGYLGIWPVFKYSKPNRNPSKFSRFVCKNLQILCETDNLIPELHNTANSCSLHGPVTDWFRSARPGNVIPVPKTSTFWGVGVHCQSQ